MATTVVWNQTDSKTTAPAALQPESLNYGADFVKRETSPNSASLVNVTSPLDRQETVRFAWSKVDNVYKGSGIDSSAFSQNRSGVSILAQLNTILSMTDDTTKRRIDLPLSGHFVFKIPNNEAITADVLQKFAARLVALLYEQSGADAGTRLNNLARGAVLPKALA